MVENLEIFLSLRIDKETYNVFLAICDELGVRPARGARDAVLAHMRKYKNLLTDKK